MLAGFLVSCPAWNSPTTESLLKNLIMLLISQEFMRKVYVAFCATRDVV